MNIVILTPIPFWHPGTQELIDGLKTFGINARALDIFHGRTVDSEGVMSEFTPSFLTGFAGKVYLRIFRKKIISEQILDGDIVDIHFLEPAYGRYVAEIKKKNVKLITTLFGSDLFRTDQSQKQMQKPVFENSDAIVLSENMIPYFEKYFSGYQDKYRFNQYGSRRLDLINELNSASNKKKFREKYAIADDRIVVSCGYNAKKEQQHLLLLNEIGKLSEFDRERLFLILSMTYGKEEAGDEYIEQVRKKLYELGVPHLFLEKRLDDEEIAEIRIISDITINTQTTDALASSVKEAMTAGDVMLVGEWLPYEIYKNMGVFFVPSSIEKLSENLKLVLNNLEEYREKSEVNAQIILDFASWSVLIKEWVKVYEEV